ncbi:restriction endonuclease subunit S, partial [Acinetobacter junii]|uniref:restriction endonuclease subunit S n=3 Tax=Acinetobacter junii TaxID=40215 RepID=UPI00068FC4E4
ILLFLGGITKSGQTNSELFITNERFEEIASKFGAPSEGDILLTSVGTLGVTYQVKAEEKFYFKDGNLTWFKDFKSISSNIIYCWLNSKDGKEQLENISIGSTQAALTIQGLKSLELNLPPEDVIQKLDEQLELIYQKVNANLKQLQKLEQLRDTLLPKLMSGEVRVQYQTAQVA